MSHLPTTSRRTLPGIGFFFYAATAIALGVLGLVWGDFATGWQRVQPGVPLRVPLAYLAALVELASGAALCWHRSARAGAAALTALYSVFVLLWVAQVIRAPLVYDGWGNVFEESSLMLAGTIAWLATSPPHPATRARIALVTRLYGFCVVSYAMEHFFYLKGAASFVPQWIPPGQMFWAVTTAICFLMAAAAIFSGILAELAARLLTAEILGFALLCWLPRLFTGPHEHFNWAGNAIGMALAASAWVMADAIHATRSPAAEAIGAPLAGQHPQETSAAQPG
jgi:hypothetical protein